MQILKHTYEKLLGSFPAVPPENGGILGSVDGLICEYFHDCSSAITECAVYTPDITLLNEIISIWAEKGILFSGMVHSHPTGQLTLSQADKEYISAVFNVIPESVQELYFPLVIPEKKKLISYKAKRSNGIILICKDKINIIK